MAPSQAPGAGGVRPARAVCAHLTSPGITPGPLWATSPYTVATTEGNNTMTTSIKPAGPFTPPRPVQAPSDLPAIPKRK